jgi:enoyl-CoA hydratase/carnithine racemase
MNAAAIQMPLTKMSTRFRLSREPLSGTDVAHVALKWQGVGTMTQSADHVRIVEETPAYWRVVFDNPPLNIVDGSIFNGLQNLLSRMGASQSLRVVVFESSNSEFYLAHFDMTGKSGSVATAIGPSGLPIPTDAFVRLTKSPVVSIAKIRGRVRGVGSEFVLACDMRFASREHTILGQPEVGAGVVPGGGATERLPLLLGRGRALEIILGADDFDGDTAERYGYVNRAIPDDELDGFVDEIARRIASFDRRPIATAKDLVNQVSLPSVERLLAGRNAFTGALTWPETQRRIQALFQRGLQQEGDLENRFGSHLAMLLET